MVQLERIVLAYDIGHLLVEIGSSLGLWLGISVIGIFDVLAAALLKIKYHVQKLDLQQKSQNIKNI